MVHIKAYWICFLKWRGKSKWGTQTNQQPHEIWSHEIPISSSLVRASPVFRSLDGAGVNTGNTRMRSDKEEGKRESLSLSMFILWGLLFEDVAFGLWCELGGTRSREKGKRVCCTMYFLLSLPCSPLFSLPSHPWQVFKKEMLLSYCQNQYLLLRQHV